MTLLKQSDSVLMQNFGISHAQFQVLAILRRGDLVSQQTLAQKSCSTPAAISRLVEALAHKKYITRRANPDNRRENFLHLTKIGMIRLKEAVELLKGLEEKLYSQLNEKELRQLLTTVEQLNRLLVV